MAVLLWLIAGIAAVSIAFFIPGSSVEFWPGMNMAGYTAAAYLIFLLAYILRPPIPAARRLVAGLCSLCIGAAIVVHWTGMSDTTHWQQSRLIAIQSNIERGIIRSETPQDLLTVLDDFHTQQSRGASTLGALFRKHFPDAALGNNLRKPVAEWDSTWIILTAITDTAITLTGTHPFSRGRNPDFVACTGRRGVLQERYTLTSKGIRHESDN